MAGPREASISQFAVCQLALSEWWRNLGHDHSVYDQVNRSLTELNGYSPFPGKPEQTCISHWQPERFNRRWFELFRQKYGVQGTRVIEYVSPLPDCLSAGSPLTSIVDNQLQHLPRTLFLDDGLDMHLTHEGAIHNTETLARIIGQRAADQN